MKFEPIPGTTVIGFGHKARQGKDVATAAIVKNVEGAMRFSFADDLYAYCRVEYDMTTKDAPLLQRVGVLMREIDPDVWVKAVYAKMLDQRPRLAVISDVRFPNEQAFVKALGGTTVKVTRLNADGTPFIDPSRPADHESEVALDNAEWDYMLVVPDGRTAELGHVAAHLAKTLVGRDEVVAA